MSGRCAHGAVWRAVAEEIVVAAYDLPDLLRVAVIATELAAEYVEGRLTLTPDGARLAAGSAPGERGA